MPLTLNDTKLWERIKKLENQTFPLIEIERLFKVGKVVDDGVNIENVQTGKTYWLRRLDVIRTYEHVKQYGKYTSADYKARIITVTGLARIIALLAPSQYPKR